MSGHVEPGVDVPGRLVGRPLDALDGGLGQQRGGRDGDQEHERLVEDQVVELRVGILELGRVRLGCADRDQLRVLVGLVGRVVQVGIEGLAIGECRARRQVEVRARREIDAVELAAIDLVEPARAVVVLDVHLDADLGQVALVDLAEAGGLLVDGIGHVVELEAAHASLGQQRSGLVEIEGVEVLLAPRRRPAGRDSRAAIPARPPRPGSCRRNACDRWRS